jgi:ATP-dependent DNA helicase RecG
MKLPININDLLTARTVEWERLALKAGWNPKAVLHTMCAFANDFHNLGGGYIIIGVKEDNGRPVLPPSGLPVRQMDAILSTRRSTTPDAKLHYSMNSAPA